MYVYQLVLEVTRRCNMQCPHCLRGNAQRLDMSREVIDAVFQQVSSVSCLTLSGGEPSLAVPVIEDILQCMRNRQIDLRSFWVYTNGKAGRDRAKRFARVLEQMYWLCDQTEPELTGLVVSRDRWHERVPVPTVYESLPFYKEDRDRDPHFILEGRAELNGIGTREAESMGSFGPSRHGDELNVHEDLYVAANGNVASTCNLSFSRIDRESLGNVLTDSLEDIVTRWEEKHGREEVCSTAY